MRILHVFRVPVGGLFRHVCDLARGQGELGHEVGILCDSTGGGAEAAQRLSEIKRYCSLGITRIPIARWPGIGDIKAISQVKAHAEKLKPQIIHCHGAKGGLYGRIAGWRLDIPSVYTPHGGSLHYEWYSLPGAVFLAAEFVLARLGSGLHFVCEFERGMFRRKIGFGGKPTAVVYNGLWPGEFEAVAPNADATDVLFVGEMRKLKGADTLIAAIAQMVSSKPISATLVGEGPDMAEYKRQVSEAALDGLIRFPGRLPVREAFKLGRLMVLPSRAESFPYVVLEAMAAGKPLIAARVGGIGEALDQQYLFQPENVNELAHRITQTLAQGPQMQVRAERLREATKGRFTAEAMVRGIVEFYGQLVRPGTEA